jgi:predicted nucleotidyltransferase
MKLWERIHQDQVRARQQTLDRLFRRVTAVATRFGVRVLPFGSYATGRVDATSDLDVAFPGDVSRDLQLRILKDLEALSRESGVDIDVVFEAETPAFFQEALHVDPV